MSEFAKALLQEFAQYLESRKTPEEQAGPDLDKVLVPQLKAMCEAHGFRVIELTHGKTICNG